MGAFGGSCPLPADAGNVDDKGTSYHAMKMVAVVCTIITGVLLTGLKISHLCNYRNPREQRQIIRIALAPSMWALVSMGGILDYKAAEYLTPVGDFIETIYLCAVFLLYVVPDCEFGDEMFQLVSEADEAPDKPAPIGWPRMTWFLIFQCPLFGLLVLAVTEITQALNDFCPNSLSPKYGNLWATIISTISLGAAISAILKFHQRTKSRINARGGFLKLICLKSIVGLQWLQSLVFGILLSHNVIKPSATFSYSDLLYGLPNTILCVEMVLFALAFWYLCPPTEYRPGRKSGPSSPNPKLPILKAIIDSLDSWDIIVGTARVFGLVSSSVEYIRQARQLKASTGGTAMGRRGNNDYYNNNNNNNNNTAYHGPYTMIEGADESTVHLAAPPKTVRSSFDSDSAYHQNA